MSPCNINVVKPEDGEPYYSNALQLQPADFSSGHHLGPSPCPNEYIATPGGNGYAYAYNSTPGFTNNSCPTRPQLTHLTTRQSQLPTGMQSDSMSDPDRAHSAYAMYTAGFVHSSMFQSPPVPQGWTIINDSFPDPSSPPNFADGSPMSQGWSPLTPNTPLSTVDPSPTVSSFPSPGLQGSSEVLRLAPSPVHPSSTLAALPDAFGHLQLADMYYRQHGSETQLSTPYTFTPPQPQPRVQQQLYDYADNESHLGVVPRRRSHSALERPLHHISPPPSFSPYPAPVSLPTRNSAPRDRSFDTVQHVVHSEYKFEGWLLPGPMVPQDMYKPHTASDRRRYVEQATLLPPIYFKRVDPLELGISLVDCTTQRFKQLLGCDDELFEDCGPSISIRLCWKGYEPWTRQIPTRNFKSTPGPITRKALARNVAKSIRRFIDDHTERPILEGTDPSWQVGPRGIGFSDLVLLSIHHVSKGSWQANVCLNRPLDQILNKSIVLQ